MACCGKAKNIAKGFATLAVDTVLRVNKYEFTDTRIRICQKCDDKYLIFRRLMCRHCNCYIPAKARVPDEKCPLGKWENG